MDYTELEPHQEVHQAGIIYDLKSLFAILLRVSDPRHARGKQYPLELLLVLILLAKLCGENTPTGIADWVAYRIDALVAMKLLPKNKAPCHMTYRRVLQLPLDLGLLDEARQRLRMVQELRTEDLERDFAAEVDVHTLEHDPHASAADLLVKVVVRVRGGLPVAGRQAILDMEVRTPCRRYGQRRKNAVAPTRAKAENRTQGRIERLGIVPVLVPGGLFPRFGHAPPHLPVPGWPISAQPAARRLAARSRRECPDRGPRRHRKDVRETPGGPSRTPCGPVPVPRSTSPRCPGSEVHPGI